MQQILISVSVSRHQVCLKQGIETVMGATQKTWFQTESPLQLILPLKSLPAVTINLAHLDDARQTCQCLRWDCRILNTTAATILISNSSHQYTYRDRRRDGCTWQSLNRHKTGRSIDARPDNGGKISSSTPLLSNSGNSGTAPVPERALLAAQETFRVTVTSLRNFVVYAGGTTASLGFAGVGITKQSRLSNETRLKR